MPANKRRNAKMKIEFENWAEVAASLNNPSGED